MTPGGDAVLADGARANFGGLRPGDLVLATGYSAPAGLARLGAEQAGRIVGFLLRNRPGIVVGMLWPELAVLCPEGGIGWVHAGAVEGLP